MMSKGNLNSLVQSDCSAGSDDTVLEHTVVNGEMAGNATDRKFKLPWQSKGDKNNQMQ